MKPDRLPPMQQKRKIDARLLVVFSAVLLLPVMPMAANLMVTEQMQKCTANEECTLVSETCDKACATVPVNKQYYDAFMKERAQACPTPISTLPQCTMNPPLSAACINNRCTLGNAYQTNGGPGDYQNNTPQAQ